MNFHVDYGKEQLAIDVDEKRVAGVISPRKAAALKNVESEVRRSLDAPFESKPLGAILEGKKSALILTVDFTRPSPRPLILPILESCMEKGVKPTIMIATGRHRVMAESEIISHLGSDIAGRFKVLVHDAFDESAIVTVGQTGRGTPVSVNRAIFEHDVIIGTGIIEPSYLCGWSGGRKLLMPGIAHHLAIDNNHFYLSEKGAVIGKLHGNPVSDDALEFAKKLPYHFITYAVVGPDDEFTEIISGDPYKAHEHGCLRSAEIFTVKKVLADIVVTSAGGHPYDCDLVQGKKAIIPAIKSVNKNGVIIVCAECAEGSGAEETFTGWLAEKTPVQVLADVRDRSKFSLGAHGAKILAMPIVEKNAKVILVTCKTMAEKLRGTYLTAVTDIGGAWKLANMITGEDSSVLFINKARRLILN